MWGAGFKSRGTARPKTAQTAFDLAMERIAKRLRRNKRRLRDHHRKSGSARREEALTAQHVILAAPADQPDDEDGGENPVIVAETVAEIESMTVSEAVMRLDLAEQPVVVFRNAANGGLSTSSIAAATAIWAGSTRSARTRPRRPRRGG